MARQNRRTRTREEDKNKKIGIMAQFQIKNGVAIIPEGTTKFGSGAFRGCTSLTSIAIPASVTEIEWGAFKNCSSLESVTIPESVTKIGIGVVDGCTSLVAINVPAKKSRNIKWYLRPNVYDKVVELAPENKTKVKK